MVNPGASQLPRKIPWKSLLCGGLLCFAGSYLEAAAAGTPPRQLVHVNFQLRWHHQFQFAGYYAALEKGYYREAGFDVTLVEGAPGRTPVGEVLAGRAQYGEANSELLYARLHGKPLVALAAIFQHSPSILLARGDSGIHTPQDLIGRNVMMIDEVSDVDLLAMLRNEGISEGQLKIVKSSYNIGDLVNGKTEAFNAYLTNEPYYLKERSVPACIIRPASYGIDFYSDILFTTAQELQDHPERVQAFRRATLRGWEYAMTHPDELIDIIASRYNSKKTLAHLRYESETMRGLIMPDLVEIGHMNPGRWKHMADVFVAQGLAEPGYSLEGFIYSETSLADTNRQKLYTALKLAVLGILGSGGIAIFLYRFNQRLRREVEERKIVEQGLRKLSGIVENTSDIVMVTNLDSVIEYVNPGFEMATGYKREEVLGRTPEFLKSGRQDDEVYRRIWHTVASGNVFRGTLANRRKDGSVYNEELAITPLRNANGETINYVSTGKDITERISHQEQLSHIAHHDALTGLPNRMLFMDRLAHAIANAGRANHLVGLLFIDLDHFKKVNDSLGHQVGDALLVKVAGRLREAVRASDTVARLGGDEFTVIVENIDLPEEVQRVAEKVLELFAAPFEVEGRALHVTPSIGLTLYPEDGRTASELLQNADLAMYVSKQAGRNSFQRYESRLGKAASERMQLEMELQRALDNDEFVLYYQPVVALLGNRMPGAEALLRWHHPQRGILIPEEFIGVLEETGMIVPVTRRALAQIAGQLNQWQSRLPPDFNMAVNLTVGCFRQPDMTKCLLGLLEANGMQPGQLTVEITESVLMHSIETVRSICREMKSHGVRIALDDFGTGFSSLSHLREFPIDYVKIDRSFVRDLPRDQSAATMVAAIIDLAHNLKLQVVAEGVETGDQQQFLAAHGCDAVQGYLYAPPLPSSEFMLAYARLATGGAEVQQGDATL